MSAIKKQMVKQFGNPQGFIGRLAGLAMAYKNQARSWWAFSLLDVQPDDRILEIGFGPGRTMQEIAARLETGRICGIDRSDIMVQQAAKRNSKAMKAGKVELSQGTVDDLNYPENTFDKILAVNVHFFWQEPLEEFRQLRKQVKSDGKLFLVFQPRWATSEDHVGNIAEKTKRQLLEAGFQKVTIDFKAMKPVTCVGIIAE